jgi:hypothetical protein
MMVMQKSGYQRAKKPYGGPNFSISVPIRAHLRLNPLMNLDSFLVQPFFGWGLVMILLSELVNDRFFGYSPVFRSACRMRSFGCAQDDTFLRLAVMSSEVETSRALLMDRRRKKKGTGLL